MAVLRFPSNVQNDNKPYVLFTTHRARYNNTGNAINTNLTSNGVALYLPTGYNVSDLLRYETEATGIIGNIFERVQTGNGLQPKDLVDAAEAIAVDKATAIAAAAGGLIASRAGAAGAAIGAATGAGVVGNIKAAGVGITLTAAEAVIINDLSFVPGDLSQAEDRAYRYGQKNSVSVYYPIFDNSIEGIIYDMVNQKKQNIGTVMGDNISESGDFIGELMNKINNRG